MADDQPIEDFLDILGDRCAREILEVLGRKPQSAQEMSNQIDFSRATVYRRLETLEGHDLVKSRTMVSDDGNHYKLYESNFDSAVVTLTDDGYDVQIIQDDTVSDRFADLWDDLHPG